MRTTRISRFIPAPASRIYQTILDPAALPRWKVPKGMTLQVHQFEARQGGHLRVSLTYHDPGAVGKSVAHTDTYSGRFLQLIPNQLIVERDEFETDDPQFAGAMTITIELASADGGTALTATHEGVPPGVSLADNETGWNMALDKLTTLVTQRSV